MGQTSCSEHNSNGLLSPGFRISLSTHVSPSEQIEMLSGSRMVS
jgi:hypothetical protein